jgi:putative ABC transport system permease protein
MLNFDLIKWVVISFILASPMAYYAINKWLANFPYKAPVSWWVFLLSGIIVVVFALLTITWQSWRTANRNPEEALRYE